jgi:hypothetical protein
MRIPPCCVKSKARDQFGVLVKFDDVNNEVMVRGYGDRMSPKFVWTGTILEYFATWDCD